MPSSQRSLCAQLRSGIIPLHIETGRHRGVTKEEKNCEYCELNEVENEIHFCPLYHDLRQTLFKKVHVPDLDLIGIENN